MKAARLKQKSESKTDISVQIREWARNNDWYRVDIKTNQLRLEQTFGQIIESIAKDMEYQNQHRMSRQIFDCYDLLSAKCRKIDLVCRNGCRNTEEMLELEFLRGKAVAAAAELAEVFAILQAKSEKGLTKNSLACEKPNHSNRNRRTRTASSELSEREKQVWATIHVQGKTIAQAAIEFNCTPQNISKHHNNAERKMNAKKSRSANTSYRLPEDDRGQISLG